MSKPYDAASKDLIETDPAGWVAFLGYPVETAAVRLVDADVSTITADADKVICIDESNPWLMHLEIQTHHDDDLPQRLHRYNALLQHRHHRPVASVAVLLRPAAHSPILTGVWSIQTPVVPALGFRYRVVRVWELSPRVLLDGPLGLTPLAAIADVRMADLPSVEESLRTRLSTTVENRSLSARLWTATYLLMGLRYEQSLIDNVLSGVLQMEDSVTYQAIVKRGLQQGLQQGAANEARKLLLLAGQKRFGHTPPGIIETWGQSLIRLNSKNSSIASSL